MINSIFKKRYKNLFLVNIFILISTSEELQNECAPCDDSDQPGHLPSLIRVFAVCLMAEDPRFLHAGSEDSDQTAWMPRLI